MNWVKVKNRLYKCDGTADDVQIQEALNYLTPGRTRQETVKCVGDFSISSPIVIPDYTILDLDNARFELDANITRMFESEAYGTGRTQYWAILGGILDGNYVARTTGCGIEGAFAEGYIDGTVFTNFEENPIHYEGFATGVALANNHYGCWFGQSAGATGSKLGVHLDHQGGSCGDHQFTSCYFINNSNYDVKIDISHHNKFVNCHFAGADQLAAGNIVGVDLVEGYGNQFTGCHWEYTDLEAIKVHPTSYPVRNLSIVGCEFRDTCRDADDTYSTILLDATLQDVILNSITGNTFLHQNAGNAAKYAIYLKNAKCDHNAVVGNAIHSTSYVSGAIQNDGAANEVAHNPND